MPDINDNNQLVVQEESEYRDRYGFRADTAYSDLKKGISEDVVREISRIKDEPEWMLKKRLLGLKIFLEKPNPSWGPDLSKIDYDDIYYYVNPNAKRSVNWEDLPSEIKETFDKLGIPEAERRFFAGAEAQFDSEVVYHNLREELHKQGVIFTNTDNAVKEYPELMRKYFGTIIPPSDNKFAALNTAAWSGGSFIYIPKGVKVAIPLQAYFRINAEKSGQFERTLIIADEGSDVTYLEGCTATIYSTSSLHSAVVEIVVHKGAHVRYVTIQNWSRKVYNLVTQRAYVYENGHMEWIDANIGSGINMKYPSAFLKGDGAKGEILSIAVAGNNQIQDSGGKVYHLAPNTTSKIISKSVSKGSGVASYRGLIHIDKRATNSKSVVKCDALLLDEGARTNTYPYNEIYASDAMLSHEATVGKVGQDELFYLMSRGMSEEDAIATIVTGFIRPLIEVLPMEYSLELKRLIKLDTTNSVG
ncbi:MAG: Fe-S cluster assembly protein SufB [Candidatus Marsarchaeota archaeon]|jgi:Fe-S cluster assembly protein SufB|nr:Fe-S cluster assembly protein SufB [Candidatus Marsarchaeota archaeon]